MKQQWNLGDFVKEQLSRVCTLRAENIGADARLAKCGMVFETKVYGLEGLGHLCILRMKAPLGLMSMETVVLSCTHRDVPLFNLDRMHVPGKELAIAELYDTQLAPWPQGIQDDFGRIKARYADVADAAAKAHLYDAVLYPCSFRKAGRGVSARLSEAAAEYVQAFLAQLESAEACDAEAKQARVRGFAERLLAEGGPAVDLMTKLFGRETAERLVLRHMYGTARSP